MTLSPEHKALFCLLRSGLWERNPDDLSAFPLTDAAWRDVYRMAVRQTVAGLVFRGLHYLPDTMLPDDGLMIRWVAQANHIERRNWRMNKVVASLSQRLDYHGLHPVLLKGQGVAAFYESPLLRECGDIDLYLPSKEEMRRAADVMTEAGCLIERQPDGSCRYDWHGVEIEHHARLFDLSNPWLKGCLAALTDKHGFTSSMPSVPSPLLNLLLLNAHLLKHLMGHGIGLRQFCDMARAYHRLKGSYSPEELAAVYRRTGLWKWSVQLHTMLTEHLGLSPDDLPFSDIAARTSPDLLRVVLEGGNFGQYGDTKGKASQTVWERKIRTLYSFWKRRGFSHAYASKEAFWTTIRLMIGNLR